jgi:hypothetical protein
MASNLQSPRQGEFYMHPRRYALIGGSIMLIIGLLSLIPTLNYPIPASFPLVNVDTSYGYFLNMFPMNIYNKIALIFFGVFGLVAANLPATNLPMSIRFSRAVFVVMGAAAILGAIPSTQTLGGYWPLFGAEVWAHGIFAALGAYFGFVLTGKASQNPEVKAAVEPKFADSKRKAM